MLLFHQKAKSLSAHDSHIPVIEEFIIGESKDRQVVGDNQIVVAIDVLLIKQIVCAPDGLWLGKTNRHTNRQDKYKNHYQK